MTRRSPTNLSRRREAEEFVCAQLPQPGRRLAARNCRRPPFGEINFVMQERDTLVFVEVRYRANSDFGAPSEAVDTHKQARWRATAEYYLQNTSQASKKACRFDIVAITGDGEDGMFRWSRDVF